jgi:hypothetical protein
VAQRLLVEPSAEFPMVMMLATAPRIVKQQINSSLLALHAFEQLFDIGINCWSQRTAMSMPPRAVTISAVSSIVPGGLSTVAAPLTLRPVT